MIVVLAVATLFTGLSEELMFRGVALQAMGNVGADLIVKPETSWKRSLKKLKKIDWSRVDGPWDKRSMENGRISKARAKVILTGNYIKQQLGVPLNPVEEETERKFM